MAAETDDALDLSGYTTAAGAAKALYRYLRDELDAGDEVSIYEPDEAADLRGLTTDCWLVTWEGGPYEWATCLTGGTSLYRAELGLSFDSTPEVTGFYDQDEWGVECHYSFDMLFYNR